MLRAALAVLKKDVWVASFAGVCTVSTLVISLFIVSPVLSPDHEASADYPLSSTYPVVRTTAPPQATPSPSPSPTPAETAPATPSAAATSPAGPSTADAWTPGPVPTTSRPGQTQPAEPAVTASGAQPSSEPAQHEQTPAPSASQTGGTPPSTRPPSTQPPSTQPPSTEPPSTHRPTPKPPSRKPAPQPTTPAPPTPVPSETPTTVPDVPPSFSFACERAGRSGNIQVSLAPSPRLAAVTTVELTSDGVAPVTIAGTEFRHSGQVLKTMGTGRVTCTLRVRGFASVTKVVDPSDGNGSPEPTPSSTSPTPVETATAAPPTVATPAPTPTSTTTSYVARVVCQRQKESPHVLVMGTLPEQLRGRARVDVVWDGGSHSVPGTELVQPVRVKAALTAVACTLYVDGETRPGWSAVVRPARSQG